MKNYLKFAGPTLGALALAGCVTVGPDYRKPDLAMPETWSVSASKEKLTDLTKWWSTFKDPVLEKLVDAAEKDNPTLSKAAAAIEKARANRSSVDSGFLPELSATASGSGAGSLNKSAGTSGSVGTTYSASAGLDASWELDIVGKNRRSSESANDLVQARVADWHDARVSLAAEVATAYVDYRACRLKEMYYAEQADSQEKTGRLTNLSANAGFTAPADARLAEASAASTRSTALAQKTECQVLVTSLVALTGLTDAALRQHLGGAAASLPKPEELRVTSVPADLLRQRPDIVSAERTLASTNALIGVAEAGRYPSLSLSGSVSLSATSGTAMSAPWSFGPTLNLPLFNGGKTEASIKSARSDYDSALADYQQTVRTAVKEVEQALTRLDSMAKREDQARISAEGYRAYLSATEQNWRVGRSSLLDLETARRSSISADITLLELQQSRLEYWIALYKAVGGGWKENDGGAK
ncbi:efflux transporter outer membrane subunit [Geobacter sp. FeAm09]|uniref:efflux transporter outer membrane subunit n=1 Tax=Geobacter sp. FeAm09 TaxID=2597769 RepID=UPI0011EBBB6B|nr:efflux transporter outer membrane subunit [Geobacter sp. FeAm09]QEM70008.1 efflux transporter outer membrane subunit [Geobacter sp. FeAm09]